MRFTQLAGKEVINILDGERLGRLGECDLAINEVDGTITAMIVPPRPRLWRAGHEARIPWQAIRRIGPDVMIVELALEELPRRSGKP